MEDYNETESPGDEDFGTRDEDDFGTSSENGNSMDSPKPTTTSTNKEEKEKETFSSSHTDSEHPRQLQQFSNGRSYNVKDDDKQMYPLSSEGGKWSEELIAAGLRGWKHIEARLTRSSEINWRVVVLLLPQ